MSDKTILHDFATKHGKTLLVESTEIQNVVFATPLIVNYNKGAIVNVDKLTGNFDLVLRNVPNGGSGVIELKQDATGSRLLLSVKHVDLNEKFRGSMNLTTTAGRTDLLRYERIGNVLYISIDKNYA